MSDAVLVTHCSPTLAGIKTANMYTDRYSSREEVVSQVRRLNRELKDKGIRVYPIRYHEGRVLLYVYRPAHLKEDLKNHTSRELLAECGYPAGSSDRTLSHLTKKIRETNKVPHEIGLFLGYPPEDVLGFINEGPKKCRLSGAWKVYANEEEAKKTFEKYKKCTSDYQRRWAKEPSVKRLAAAV